MVLCFNVRCIRRKVRTNQTTQIRSSHQFLMAKKVILRRWQKHSFSTTIIVIFFIVFTNMLHPACVKYQPSRNKCKYRHQGVIPHVKIRQRIHSPLISREYLRHRRGCPLLGSLCLANGNTLPLYS